MTAHFPLHRTIAIGTASVLGSAPSYAEIVAQTPSISGNGWVALGIISAVVATIYLLIMGVLHVERRDARLGRRANDDGWFGVVNHDDDDPPDFHQHGNS